MSGDPAKGSIRFDIAHSDLLAMLLALDGVQQSPRYHPEGDALYHSLQVFDLARRESNDPILWAAALLHDVGKADEEGRHDETGADLLDGLVAPRIVWLVRHHLDLLREPRLAQRRYRGQRELDTGATLSMEEILEDDLTAEAH